MDSVLGVHGHDGATRVVWTDGEQPPPAEETDSGQLRQRWVEALARHYRPDDKRWYCKCGAWIEDMDGHRVDVLLAARDEELDRLRAERDQAIAHDRQPYPTAWAYEQACAALEKHRERADTAEAEITRLRAGADPTPVPEAANHTPAQWLHRLLEAPAEERLEVITRLEEAQARADRCFLSNHEGAGAELRAARAEAEQLRERLAAQAWIQGKCPACGRGSLFIGEGGYLTCSHLECPDPEAPTKALEETSAAEQLRRVRDIVADMHGVTGARHWARAFDKALDEEQPAAPSPEPAPHRYVTAAHCDACLRRWYGVPAVEFPAVAPAADPMEDIDDWGDKPDLPGHVVRIGGVVGGGPVRIELAEGEGVMSPDEVRRRSRTEAVHKAIQRIGAADGPIKFAEGGLLGHAPAQPRSSGPTILLPCTATIQANMAGDIAHCTREAGHYDPANDSRESPKRDTWHHSTYGAGTPIDWADWAHFTKPHTEPS
jgi:hypothetical protein